MKDDRGITIIRKMTTLQRMNKTLSEEQCKMKPKRLRFIRE